MSYIIQPVSPLTATLDVNSQELTNVTTISGTPVITGTTTVGGLGDSVGFYGQTPQSQQAIQQSSLDAAIVELQTILANLGLATM